MHGLRSIRDEAVLHPPSSRVVGPYVLYLSAQLMVVLPAVSDGRPAPGVAFTLSATVQNVGDAAAAATTLRFYRSTDSTITTSHTAVGTDAVAELAASRGSDQSVEVTAIIALSYYRQYRQLNFNAMSVNQRPFATRMPMSRRYASSGAREVPGVRRASARAGT